MENPKTLARPHVESADVTFHVFPALGNPAGQVRSSHDHDVPGDDGRRMKTDVPVDQVDVLIVVLLQIDYAVFAECWYARARLCIQRDEPVAGRDVQDSLFLAVRPVGESVAR